MDEKINETIDVAQQDYETKFIPQVHRIGRLTMAIAMVLSFLPVAYFVFVKGYNAGLSSYMLVFTVMLSKFGMWISEPLSYWPVLGSAGTYMGYLSGNVSGMRFPVAMNLQSTMKADINSPRGQIVTIAGIAASIFTSLIILLIICLAGDQIVNLLPEVVLKAFTFVMPGIVAGMLVLRCNGSKGIVKGALNAAPYFVLGFICKYTFAKIIPGTSRYALLIAVLACMALGYFMYLRDCKKDAAAAK